MFCIRRVVYSGQDAVEEKEAKLSLPQLDWSTGVQGSTAECVLSLSLISTSPPSPATPLSQDGLLPTQLVWRARSIYKVQGEPCSHSRPAPAVAYSYRSSNPTASDESIPSPSTGEATPPLYHTYPLQVSHMRISPPAHRSVSLQLFALGHPLWPSCNRFPDQDLTRVCRRCRHALL